MTSQVAMSKTEQYNAQIDALCECADTHISGRAKKVKYLGFDPTRIEEVLGISLKYVRRSETLCAHCPTISTFASQFYLRDRTSARVYLRFDPMDKYGLYLNMVVNDHPHEMCRGFWIDNIDVDNSLSKVVLKTHTNKVFTSDGDVLIRGTIDIRGSKSVGGDAISLSFKSGGDRASDRVLDGFCFHIVPILDKTS